MSDGPCQRGCRGCPTQTSCGPSDRLDKLGGHWFEPAPPTSWSPGSAWGLVRVSVCWRLGTRLRAMWRRNVVLLLLAAGLLGLAETGRASISIAENAVRPVLCVDARGNAEVSWSSGGVRRTLLVPAVGLDPPGGRISTADVSRPATIAGVPFAETIRRGPDGTFYALQSWRVEPTGPVELHFSRWKGARTTVALASDPGSGSEPRVERAQFQGSPVSGYSRRNSGSDIASSPSLTASVAPKSAGVVSAESRRALTERFDYSSNPTSVARGTA